MNREELQKVHDALSLLNSMVNCGDQHSPTSVNMTQAAFAILRKSLPPAEGANCFYYDKPGKEKITHKQQPTAEGAEEYYCRKWGVAYSEIERLKKLKNIQFSFESIMQMLNEFATLHAQRIADKMVSERISNYVVVYRDREDRWEQLSTWLPIERAIRYYESVNREKYPYPEIHAILNLNVISHE